MISSRKFPQLKYIKLSTFTDGKKKYVKLKSKGTGAVVTENYHDFKKLYKEDN